jgi:ribonuclease J
MIEMVRPRSFIPVHGTLHHLLRHAALAHDLGVPDVCVLENGEMAELDEGALRKTGRVRAGRVHVFARRALPAGVLNERTALAAHGAAHLVVPVDAAGRPAREVSLVTRGVLDEALDAHVLAAARSEVVGALAELTDRLGLQRSDGELEETARQAVRRSFFRALGFKPVTTVTVLRIGS